MLIFFTVVILMIAMIVQLTEPAAVQVHDISQLDGVDFSREIAQLSTTCYTRYPGVLYTPADFAGGKATWLSSDEHPMMEHGYGTYRMVLRLKPGRVYGVSGYTATYAQKFWIDGELIQQTGIPGDSIETTVPKTEYFTVYFTAQEETDIVLQRSDFVHANGGQVFPLYLGEQTRITALTNGILLRGILLVGFVVMAALFSFGIFLFFRNMPHLLWFSLACLSIAVYALIVSHKMIMLLFPDMPWIVSHRMEYVAAAGMQFFYFMYIMRMFHQSMRHPVNIIGTVIGGGYLSVVLFTPSIQYTAMMPWLRGLGVGYCCMGLALLIYSMKKDRENRRPEHYLMVCGTFLYLVLTIIGIPLHGSALFGNGRLFRLGMVLLVFANIVALAISFTHTEAALDEAREKHRELDASNRMLDSLNTMKTKIVASIGHELKTPLTVMSVNAQMSKKLLHMGGNDSEIERSLNAITGETKRLARMVSEMLDLSTMQEGCGEFAPVDLRSLLVKTAEIYRTLLKKKGNSLTLDVPRVLPLVDGNADMLVQVVVNLLSNANAHTNGDAITLAARSGAGEITVAVSDNGGGIPAWLLPHVFERYRTDGENRGTGLGLPICKDIVEKHGGKIAIDSVEGGGTSVQFTLPLHREDTQNEQEDDIASGR